MPQDNNILADIKQVLDISSRVDERVKTIQANQQEMKVQVDQILVEFSGLSSRVLVLESKNGTKLHEMENLLHDLKIRVEKIDVGGTIFSKDLEDELSGINNDLSEIHDKLNGMENKIKSLELHEDDWKERLKTGFGFILNILGAILIGYILFKMGITGNFP